MKKQSKSKLGTYYKYRTKKYYQKLGYTVTLSEFMFRAGGFFVKKDIFGSDIIAMNEKEIIFVNSKFCSTKASEYDAKSKGLAEFNAFPFPPHVKRFVAIWNKGDRKPQLFEATGKSKNATEVAPLHMD